MAGSVHEKPILQTLRGRKTESIPFWLMRQAGRYLPEYRAVRASKNGFLDMAFDPSSAAEITMQPVRRFRMDGAIIFSDILVIPWALGQNLEFLEGEGPRLGELNPGKLEMRDLEEKLSPVFEALSRTRDCLAAEGYDRTALIGFAGAPWTVVTYMVEGGGSKDFAKVKTMAYAQPENFARLMDILVESTAMYLIAQVRAGAEILQIFDTWAGALDPHGFQHQVIEPTRKIVERVKAAHPDIPIIGFPRGAAMHYPAYVAQTGVDAVGLDGLVCTKWAAAHLQTKCPVQGNLDPMRLLAGGEGLEKAARKILRDFSGGAHIFNLGHGIHKDTPPAHVERLAEIIREFPA
ncbi:MAG: uroporphyrinogen decarboxylase [Alphaproteobacteria bacterium]|nr:uroporphyrinogen decarboxylase [Alphaproteobacteria bacterium]